LQRITTTSTAPRVSVPPMPNALRTILDARQMDPVTLAQRLRDEGHDVSYHTVIAWYYGYRTPGEDNAAALAATLGVDVAEIT